jgi:non-lysosomal glucosylceramidase
MTAVPGSASGIPAIAWRTPLGVPPAAPGRTKVTHEPMIDDGPWGGVPLGGLGSGSIGRTPRGDFARWHLDIGAHRFESIPACQFSVFVASGGRTDAHVLSTHHPDALGSWNWDLPAGAGTYHALFPVAWFEYDWDRLPVHLVQRQFSPIIAGNEEESGYPVGIFEWQVENPSSDAAVVGLLFTWQNLVGRWADPAARGGQVNRVAQDSAATGIVLSGPGSEAGPTDAGSFAIAAAAEPGLRISYRSRFDAEDGADVWADFAADGALDDVDDQAPAREGQSIAAGVAVTVDLAPGERRTISFSLAWDFPVARFSGGRRWRRHYTRQFGSSGGAAWSIATEALQRRREWSAAIEAWQAPILADPSRPAWYKAALLNELYYLVDGGTLWSPDELDGSPSGDSGPFALLECFDYPFYNTLDVYFYASFALALLWPRIAARIIRDFIPTVPLDDPEVVPVWATGGSAVRKVSGALPHDIGGPAEDPFVKVNHYHLQDVNGWKDLNSKFVLLVWQGVSVVRDETLARDAWPAVMQALEFLAAFDRDGDGLPEHDGVPDQTYDTWPMRGPSAYGGSLWLAALRAGIALGTRVGDGTAVARLQALLDRAGPAFEAALWTGTHYRYDAGGGPSGDSIMADQLAGQWWADATGLDPIVPADHAATALRTIWERNVRGFADGNMGAVNGTRPDGTVDDSSEQSREVWTGTSYALAAFMLSRGLPDEGWSTAAGVDRVIRDRGYRFRTPEAYDADGNFRASMYLRPLAIWAIEHALRGTRG